MKRTSIVVLLSALTAGGSAFAAPPAASCRSVASTYAQNVVSPEPLGDEDFFAKPPGPPNVMFLLGNSASMQGYPVAIPDPGAPMVGGVDPNIGCGDTTSGITASFFNKATDGLKTFDPTYNHSFDTDTTHGSASFADRLPYEGNGGNESGLGIKNNFKDGFNSSDINHICGNTSDGSNSDIAQLLGYSNSQWLPFASNCVSCMNSVGWYRGPKMVGGPSDGKYTYGLLGRFLNKYPPKFSIARKVIRDVFLAAGPVRLGIATLSSDPAYFDPATYLFGGGGSILSPACDKALSGTGFNSSRPQLVNALHNVTYNEGGHGIGEALFSIGGYYADQASWTSWFQTVPEVTVAAGTGATLGAAVPTSDSVSVPIPGDEANDLVWDYPWTSTNSYRSYPLGPGWSDGPNTWIPGNSSAARQVFESGGASHMSMCFPCQVSTVIVISDSTPAFDNSVPVTVMDSMVGKPVITSGAGAPGGINTCVNHCGGSSNPTCVAQCDNGAFPLGPQVGNRNFMDDVAYFLSHQDLRPTAAFPGSQTVATYTVLFGNTPDPMMQGIAEAGQGLAYTSSNEQQLKSDIFAAIGDILTRSTSGASPALNNVQSSATQAAFIPRFHPARGSALWPGDLNAYFLYNEIISKCTPNGTGDLDHNGSCTGIYLLDANNIRIASDVAGQINSQVPGLYYEVDSSDNLTTTRAKPFWSAAALLGARDPSTRQVYTVLSTKVSGTFGGASQGANADPPIQFNEANWAALLPYLGITNDPGFCSSFASRSGVQAISTDTTFQTCATMLIRYVLGYDILNVESLPDDGTQPWTRVWRGSGNPTWAARGLEDQVLGDIFHSAPVRVSLPSDKRVCDLGTSDAQCVATLYASPVPIDKTGGVDAYQQWVNTQLANKEADVILAGANDGMLHVFKANCWFDGFHDPTSLLAASSGLFPAPTVPSGYTGTPYECGPVTTAGAGGQPGEELFAFISPDLLPKLKYLPGIRHNYFVDGNVMVREVWVDGLQSDNSVSVAAQDVKKQAGEYRTVAIVGERTGGTHYFALDLTDPLAFFEGRGTGSNPLQNPSGGSRFLWVYPDIGSPTELNFGESWDDFSGRPPAIGPVRYKSATGVPYGSGLSYTEKYVAIVGGGHDSLGMKGRGVYMIDAFTGATLKEFSPFADSTTYAAMLYPFGAAVGAFNWGDSPTRLTLPDNQYYWDTATVGDEGGQLWTFRFYDPDPSNWAGGRALQESKSDGTLESHRFPIFNITTNVPTPQGYLRTNVGTGDKQHLRDQSVGKCSFGNLRACITQGCNVAVSEGYETGSDNFSASYSYSSGSRNSGETYAQVSPNTLSPTPSPLLPVSSDPCLASGGVVPQIRVNGGPCSDTQSQNPNGELVCSTDPTVTAPFFTAAGTASAGAGGSCFETEGALDVVPSNYAPPALSASTYNLRNRFFSIRLFDRTGGRTIFDTPTAALNNYDANRFDDLGGSSGAGDLTIIPSTTFSFADGGSVPEDGPGWVLPYGVYDERGSANPTYVSSGGCLIWNTVEGGVYCNADTDCCDPFVDGGLNSSCGATCNLGAPTATAGTNECQSTSPCSKVGSSSQFTYTASMIDGNGGCGLAFNAAGSDGGSQPLRRLACTQNCDALPPPAPTVISFIGQDGTVQTAVISAASRDVGVLQITAPDDLVRQIYDLPVSEQVHDCRHNGNCANTP